MVLDSTGIRCSCRIHRWFCKCICRRPSWRPKTQPNGAVCGVMKFPWFHWNLTLWWNFMSFFLEKSTYELMTFEISYLIEDFFFYFGKIRSVNIVGMPKNIQGKNHKKLRKSSTLVGIFGWCKSANNSEISMETFPQVWWIFMIFHLEKSRTN